MRVHLSLTVAAALVASSALPAAAQDQSAQNQAAPSKATESRQAAKPADKKICKRLSNGKVCLTEEKWKQYEELM